MTEKIEFRQRREVGDIVSVTFTFARQNFATLGLGLLYVGIPLSVLQGIVVALYQRSITNAQSSLDPFKILTSAFGVEFLLSITLSLLLYAGVTGLIYSFIFRYLSEPDVKLIQTTDVIADTLGSALTILVTTFGLGFIIFAIAIPSVFLLFIPVIYIGVATSPMLFIRLYEKSDFFAAFSRSFKLVQGRWWQLFGIILVLYLIGFLISFVFSAPNLIVSFFIALNSTSGKAEDYAILNAITGAIASFGSVVYYALIEIGVAFAYFDLVERKESSGLLERIDKIAGASSNLS